MLDNLKSEFRKLFTVRSTYFILLISFLLELLVFWFAKGYKIDHNQAAIQSLGRADYLSTQALVAVNLLGLLCGIIVILLITHEYRYNTIMYTLAASKTRSRVLIAKFIAITIFSLVFAVVVSALAPLLTKLGLSMSHHALVHQTFTIRSIAWRILLVSWGTTMLSAVIALVVRSQVGAIAGVFIWSSTVENLLGLWLHEKQAYLPFSSLNVLMDPKPLYLSYARAASVAIAWIVGGLIVVWVLFLRRDAN